MTDIDDQLQNHYRSLKMDSALTRELTEAVAENVANAGGLNSELSDQGNHSGPLGWRKRFFNKRAQRGKNDIAFETDKYAIRNNRSIAVVCAAVLILGIGLGVHNISSKSERLERVLHEVAMNHTTRLELEFAADNIDSINTDMNQLEFDLRIPKILSDEYNLLGARYCTLSGKLAAHVKLLNKTSSERVSVFMTRADNDLASLRPTQDQVDGVDVGLWQEAGLFYVMAMAPNN